MKYFKLYLDKQYVEPAILITSNDRSSGAFRWDDIEGKWFYDGDLMASKNAWPDEEITDYDYLVDNQRRRLIEAVYTQKFGWLE